MKNALPILLLLSLVAGCGESQLETETLVGTYEAKIYDDTERFILHENGEFEWSSSDKRYERSLDDVIGVAPHGRWSIAQHREVHLKWHGAPNTIEGVDVFSVNPGTSITRIAEILEGDRQDFGPEDVDTFQQIK
jgi:hypothetical protein